MKRKIVAYHLYNDFSGSPKALKPILEGLLSRGYRVDLLTSDGGVLDSLREHENFRKISCSYRFSENRIHTMIRFIVAQIRFFLISFKYLFDSDCVFYINTIMPVGAAVAGRIMGKKVIYHYHENAHVKGGMYELLCRCMQFLADKIICVSVYQSSFLKRKSEVYVVQNTLEKTFLDKVTNDPAAAYDRKTILMLGSLKLYKGVLEFFRLAQMIPEYVFILIINDTEENITAFLAAHEVDCSKNLSIYSRQDDVARFYNSASIVLNLSKKEQFVETFGLTALEAMAASLPVIVPTVGGIAEMVEDGVNGYKIDVENLDKISEVIRTVLSDRDRYMYLAEEAFRKSQEFSHEVTVRMIEALL